MARNSNIKTLAEKLAAKATPVGDCLVWHGQADARGYGFLRLDGRLQRAHRLAYALYCGELGESDVVRHSCDNPSCINPAHLVRGKQYDNVQDMWGRGRARSSHGSANGRSKLSDEQVADIRSRFKPHDRVNGGKALAREFGISYMAMKDILAGRSYRS